jgi:hypothetical protein
MGLLGQSALVSRVLLAAQVSPCRWIVHCTSQRAPTAAFLPQCSARRIRDQLPRSVALHCGKVGEVVNVQTPRMLGRQLSSSSGPADHVAE